MFPKIGPFQGTSWNEINEELAQESLKWRRWYRSLSSTLKIMEEEATKYLTKLIPKCKQIIRTGNNKIPSYSNMTLF